MQFSGTLKNVVELLDASAEPTDTRRCRVRATATAAGHDSPVRVWDTTLYVSQPVLLRLKHYRPAFAALLRRHFDETDTLNEPFDVDARLTEEDYAVPPAGRGERKHVPDAPDAEGADAGEA